jgi:hypothetical protein
VVITKRTAAAEILLVERLLVVILQRLVGKVELTAVQDITIVLVKLLAVRVLVHPLEQVADPHLQTAQQAHLS